MSPREARLLLAARRPDGADDQDPIIRDARAVLRQSPESEAWLESEQQHDHEIASRLRETSPPDDLVDRLMALRPADRAPAAQAGSTPPLPANENLASIAPTSSPRPLPWGWLVGIGVAAVLAMLVVGLIQTRNRAASVAAETSRESFRQFAASFVSTEWDYTFDFPTGDYARLVAWLSTQPDAVRFNSPPGLRGTPTGGCKVVDWKGRKVTLVCFLHGISETIVHVLAISRADLSDVGPTVDFGRSGVWNTASWVEEGVAYVALSTLDEASLKRLL